EGARRAREGRVEVRRAGVEVPKTSKFGPRTIASRSSRPSRFQLQGARILADGGKQLQPALRHLSPLPSGWRTFVRVLDSPCRWVYQDAMARGTRRAGRRAIAAVIIIITLSVLPVVL